MSDKPTNTAEHEHQPEARNTADVGRRVEEISKLIIAEARHHLGAESALIPARHEADSMAFELTRRQKDLDESRQLVLRLQASPDKTAEYQEAQERLANAQESHAGYSAYVGRKVGGTNNFADTVANKIDQAGRWTRRAAIPLTAATAIGAYTFSGFIPGSETLWSAAKALWNSVGQYHAATGPLSSLTSLVANGGVLVGSSLLGYAAGNLIGKGIDALTQKYLGVSIGASKWGKYAGLASGLLGSAATLNITTAGLLIPGAIPLAALGGAKLLWSKFRGGQGFDVEKVSHHEKDRKEADVIDRASERIFNEVRVSTSMSRDPRFAELENFRTTMMEPYLRPALSNPDDPNSHRVPVRGTFTEIKEAWDHLKPKAEALLAEARKRGETDPKELQRRQTLARQCRDLCEEWDRIFPGDDDPELPRDIRLAVSEVERKLQALADGGAPYKLSDVESGFTTMYERYSKALNEAQTKTQDAKDTADLKLDGTAEMNNAFIAGFGAREAAIRNNPAALEPLRAARDAFLAVSVKNQQLQRARKSDAATELFREMRAESLTAQKQLRLAEENVAKARTAAQAVDRILTDGRELNAINAMRSLPALLDVFVARIKAATAIGASWERNSSLVQDARRELDLRMREWIGRPILGPRATANTLITDFATAFTSPTTDIVAPTPPDYAQATFNTAAMDIFCREAKSTLERGVAESMQPITSALAVLRDVGGNKGVFDSMIASCSNPRSLPTAEDLRSTIAPYLRA